MCVGIGWWLVLLPSGIGAWRMGLIAASDAPCSILSMDALMINTDRQRQPNDGHEDAIKQERSCYRTKIHHGGTPTHPLGIAQLPIEPKTL